MALGAELERFIGGSACGFFGDGRQDDGNDGAFFWFAGNHDGSAMALHDAEHRRHAESAADEFGGEKRIEEFGAHGVIHAAAGVAHFQNNVDGRGGVCCWSCVSARKEASHSRTLVETVTTPGLSPTASEALVTRFMSTCCIWAASAWINGNSEARFNSSRTDLEMETFNKSAQTAHEFAEVQLRW